MGVGSGGGGIGAAWISHALGLQISVFFTLILQMCFRSDFGLILGAILESFWCSGASKTVLKIGAQIKSEKVVEFDAKMVEKDARIYEKSKVFIGIAARGQLCKNTCFPAGFQCLLRFQ